MDVFSPEKRSKVMAGIRSRNNRSTEQAFISYLKKFGITGWRRHYPLPGKPDLVFFQRRIVVFIDGCFWHGCPKCYDGHIPVQNNKYWAPKLARNRTRDRRNNRELRKAGWHVFRVRECSISGRKPALFAVLSRLRRVSTNSSTARVAKTHRTLSNKAA
jgi:DNA mismatch endonuclease, patch repair protein